jgi:class 3 adenylate cyclase
MRAILIAHRKGESTHMRDGKTQPTSNRPYNFTAPTHDPLRGWHRGALLIVALALVSGLLLWLGQLAGAALLLLAGLLLHALRQRDRRARALARQIAAGRLDTKIEVGSGAWGDLSHAVNGLMQEQRVQVRLRTVLPTPLPAEALQALLGGQFSTAGASRMTAVLLVSCASRATPERDQHAALLAWQTLAQATHDLAQRHGALLQPCGGAILLAFGTFADRPIGEPLRAALAAAEALQRSWRDRDANTIVPLVLSLAIGQALTGLLPGLGYCVLGAPVEEAIQLQQLAHQMGQHGLISGEGVYYARRQADGPVWQPTDLRIPAPNRGAQVVYTHVEHAT